MYSHFTNVDSASDLPARRERGKDVHQAVNGDLSVQSRLISDLKPFERNARTHTKQQIRKIAESIRTFGFTYPVLIDQNDTIVAGHGRVQAAKLLSLVEVPTIRLDHLTPEQVRAYVIADNRLAEDAGWDDQILKIKLQHLILKHGHRRVDHRIRDG